MQPKSELIWNFRREILKWTGNGDLIAGSQPKNAPLTCLANGFAEAWRLYGSKRAIVLFLVLEIEINIADQRHLEYAIVDQEPGIDVERCTLAELDKNGVVAPDSTLY